MYYLILISFLILSVLLVLISTLITFFITKVPFVISSKRVKNEILKVANIKENDVFYDLGCGIADSLVLADKKYRARAFGYEISPIPYIIARLNIYINKSKAKVFCSNFFKADLSKADIVFCYLIPSINIRLKDKLEPELKKGTKVISYAFSFPGWKISKKIILKKRNNTPIFLYIR